MLALVGRRAKQRWWQQLWMSPALLLVEFDPFLLGGTKPQLKSSVVAVFIASEGNSSIPGVGVDALVKDGLLDKLKQGRLFWIDTADKQPCIGTGGMIPWHLHVSWKLFHSDLPHKLPINQLKQVLCPDATQ